MCGGRWTEETPRTCLVGGRKQGVGGPWVWVQVVRNWVLLFPVPLKTFRASAPDSRSARLVMLSLWHVLVKDVHGWAAAARTA